MSLSGDTLQEVKNLQRIATEAVGLVPLQEDKLHITLLHQSLGKDLVGKQLPAYTGKISLGDVYVVSRPNKRSCFVVVREQEEIREYVKALGVAAEALRVFHVSLGSLTGSPMDSVGHTEANPIMEGAERLP
jgi:hypothetical protein